MAVGGVVGGADGGEADGGVQPTVFGVVQLLYESDADGHATLPGQH